MLNEKPVYQVDILAEASTKPETYSSPKRRSSSIASIPEIPEQETDE